MITEQELQSLCFNLNVLALQTEWSLHLNLNLAGRTLL